MSSLKAFQVAAELAERQRDAARQTLKDVQAALQAAQAQLEQLAGYAGETQGRWGMREGAEVQPEVVAAAFARLDAWHGSMMALSETDVDPLQTVMREGGPYHCRGELPAYLERLRATGRADKADALAKKYLEDLKKRARIVQR